MSIFVLKSTGAYLYLFAVILSLGHTRNVPRDGAVGADETRPPVDILDRMRPSSELNLCSLPEQPINGGWKLDPLFCDNSLDCEFSPGSFVDEGSHLIYTCDSGYQVEGEGDTDVYCTAEGEWTTIPNCIRSVEADTIETSSSMTTTTTASSAPRQKGTSVELSESENDHSKKNNSETIKRRSKISKIVGTVAKVGCHLILGFFLGSMGDPVCEIGGAVIAKD